MVETAGRELMHLLLWSICVMITGSLSKCLSHNSGKKCHFFFSIFIVHRPYYLGHSINSNQMSYVVLNVHRARAQMFDSRWELPQKKVSLVSLVSRHKKSSYNVAFTSVCQLLLSKLHTVHYPFKKLAKTHTVPKW